MPETTSSKIVLGSRDSYMKATQESACRRAESEVVVLQEGIPRIVARQQLANHNLIHQPKVYSLENWH